MVMTLVVELLAVGRAVGEQYHMVRLAPGRDWRDVDRTARDLFALAVVVLEVGVGAARRLAQRAAAVRKGWLTRSKWVLVPEVPSSRTLP